MRKEYFRDNFFIDNSPNTWKYLDNGTVLIPAKFTRVGVFSYSFGDVYRSAEEVLSKESVESMINKPFTDEHPKDGVYTENWQDLAKGIITEAFVDGEIIRGTLLVWDNDMIETLKTKKELSMGYEAELQDSEGVFKDSKYSLMQKNIRYNHVSSVWLGRAGREIVVDNDDINLKGDKMTVEKSVKEIQDGYEAKVAVLNKEIEKLKSANKVLQDKLENTLLKETLELGKSLGFTVDNAKSAVEAKKEIVSKYLDIDTKDMSNEFLDGALNSIVALKNKKDIESISKKDLKDNADVVVIDV